MKHLIAIIAVLCLSCSPIKQQTQTPEKLTTEIATMNDLKKDVHGSAVDIKANSAIIVKNAQEIEKKYPSIKPILVKIQDAAKAQDKTADKLVNDGNKIEKVAARTEIVVKASSMPAETIVDNIVLKQDNKNLKDLVEQKEKSIQKLSCSLSWAEEKRFHLFIVCGVLFTITTVLIWLLCNRGKAKSVKIISEPITVKSTMPVIIESTSDVIVESTLPSLKPKVKKIMLPGLKSPKKFGINKVI